MKKRGMGILIDFVKGVQSARTIDNILESGDDVETKDYSHNTALHYCYRYSLAARKYDIEDEGLAVVKLLIQYGADVNVVNIHGKTPLMEIIEHKCPAEIIRELLNAGADTNIVDRFGNTALHSYVKYKTDICADVFKLLVDKHSDFNLINNAGNTILILCVECNIEYIRMLLKAGADPKITGSGGRTVLHVCATLRNKLKAREDCLDLVKLFVEYGADINARNANGSTPLKLFISNKGGICKLDLFQYLLDKGAVMSLVGSNIVSILDPFVYHGEDYSRHLEMLLEYGIVDSVLNTGTHGPMRVFLDKKCIAELSKCIMYLKLFMKHGARIEWEGSADLVALRRFYDASDAENLDTVLKYAMLQDMSYQDTHRSFLRRTEITRGRSKMNRIVKELNKMADYMLKPKSIPLLIFLKETDYKKLGFYHRVCRFNMKQIKTKFPSYFPLVEAKLEVAAKWCKILRRAKALSFSSFPAPNGKVVELNPDCVCYVTQYLSSYDLWKLTRAAAAQS